MANFFEEQEWLDAVANLREKAAIFIQTYNQILSTSYIANEYNDLKSEFDSLITQGNIIKNTIETLTQGIDYIFSVINNVFGDDGVNGLSNMGVIPLIPIAVIAAAIAAIVYWLKDAGEYLDKVNRIQQLKQEGYTSEKAYDMVYQTNDGFFTFKNMALIGTGIFALFLISRRLRA